MNTHADKPTAAKIHQSIWMDLMGVPFSQNYVMAGKVRTRFLHCGAKGKPGLILIHGTGGHAEAYVRNLGAHGQHFDAYAVDMVGHGLSDRPLQNYEIADYVAHLAAFMDAVGLQRASISGESMGGWIAAAFALKYPGRVDRLVLNTTGGATMDEKVMAIIKEKTMAAVNDPSMSFIRARLEWLMADPSRVNDDLVATRQRVYLDPAMKTIMPRILCLQEPEIRRRNLLKDEDWAAIAAETLVLWTSHDPTAAATVGRRLAELIPNARFALMDGCGHWPQFEDAETFNRLHLDFLLGRS